MVYASGAGCGMALRDDSKRGAIASAAGTGPIRRARVENVTQRHRRAVAGDVRPRGVCGSRIGLANRAGDADRRRGDDREGFDRRRACGPTARRMTVVPSRAPQALAIVVSAAACGGFCLTVSPWHWVAWVMLVPWLVALDGTTTWGG